MNNTIEQIKFLKQETFFEIWRSFSNYFKRPPNEWDSKALEFLFQLMDYELNNRLVDDQ